VQVRLSSCPLRGQSEVTIALMELIRIYFFLNSFESRFALLERTKSPLCRGSHCLYACGFRIYFTPLPGFFSPFPHGTGSLSVDHEYLALEDGPPIFRQDFTCPALLVARPVPPSIFRIRGYHPCRRTFQTVLLNPWLYRAGCSNFARHYFRNLG
jgi:hypothetical protein